MTATLEALELLAEIKTKIARLNEVLDLVSDDDLRKHNLQTDYWFGGGGSVNVGNGMKPILEKNSQNAARAFRSDIDYDHYRKKLRAMKVAEPEIWFRFPPQNADERAERETRMQTYGERKARTILIHDPFKAYCLAEAKQVARRDKRTVAEVMASPGFLQSCKELWEIVI